MSPALCRLARSASRRPVACRRRIPAPPAGQGCDPSYPEVCLAANPDLDCIDICYPITVICDPAIGAYDPHASTRTSTALAASRRSAMAGALRPSRVVLAAKVALALLGGIDGTGSAEMACDPSYPAYCEQPTCDPSTTDVAGCCAWDGSGDPGFLGQDPPLPPYESWYPCRDWCD